MSCLFRGATATTLQTRGISLSDEGRVQPDILGYGRDHQADSPLWLFWQRFELEAKVSHCILRFNEAGLSHPRDESKGRRMLNGTLGCCRRRALQRRDDNQVRLFLGFLEAESKEVSCPWSSSATALLTASFMTSRPPRRRNDSRLFWIDYLRGDFDLRSGHAA